MYGNELYKLLLARDIVQRESAGYWGQIIRQHTEQELEKIIKEDIEKEIDQIKVKPSVQVYLNTRKNYGITSEHIASFNNYELRELFNGVNNLEIPYVMAVNMNEAEILALYTGIARMKRNGSNEESGLEGFYNAIKAINNSGFRSNTIAEIKKTGFNPHQANPGDQKRRFEEMPQRIRQQFLRKYLEELKISHQAVKNDVKGRQGSFYDRNSDGFNRGFYITDIRETIAGSYERTKAEHLKQILII